jgi:hypothetical protein
MGLTHPPGRLAAAGRIARWLGTGAARPGKAACKAAFGGIDTCLRDDAEAPTAIPGIQPSPDGATPPQPRWRSRREATTAQTLQLGHHGAQCCRRRPGKSGELRTVEAAGISLPPSLFSGRHQADERHWLRRTAIGSRFAESETEEKANVQPFASTTGHRSAAGMSIA